MLKTFDVVPDMARFWFINYDVYMTYNRNKAKIYKFSD